MLKITDGTFSRNCTGWQRRDFLRVGSLGLGSLALPDWLALRSCASGRGVLREKSVVLLFLHGGPSHIEFFDPKMTAPAEFRSITGEISTQTPGVSFGSSFPQLAQRMENFSIVRSYGSKNSAHTYNAVASGGNPLKAAMGSIYARVAGANHPQTGMPQNTLVVPEAVEEGLKLGRNFETNELHTVTDPGELGATCAAFDPSGGGPLKEAMKLQIPGSRLADRRSLLRGLDQIKRAADAENNLSGVDQYQQQAFDMITRGIAQAFDLSKEDPQTIKRYDTTGKFRNADMQRYHDMKRTTNLLGHQMLLARRLCEAGCGFVTVSDCGWDMHANGNSPKNMTALDPMARQVDHAVSAFIEDVHERGLSQDILLIVTGEMGRTPRLNGNGGRDHYGEFTPMLMAGGGLQMGQVIGQSDRHATRPATEPFAPSHLMSTVMHTLFDVGQLRLQSDLPTELVRAIENGKPFSGLL